MRFSSTSILALATFVLAVVAAPPAPSGAPPSGGEPPAMNGTHHDHPPPKNETNPEPFNKGNTTYNGNGDPGDPSLGGNCSDSNIKPKLAINDKNGTTGLPPSGDHHSGKHSHTPGRMHTSTLSTPLPTPTNA